MTLKNLFVFNAIVAVLFGVGYLISPNFVLASYGVTLSEAGELIGRALGAVYLEVGLLTWMVRDLKGGPALRSMVLAFFVGNVLGLIVILLGQLSGIANALGWSAVAIYALLALGYGYFQFVKPVQP
jgi:hypothetical protein